MNIRYTVTADEPEVTTTELLEYLNSGNAPVNATTGQVRAIAFLWSVQHQVMSDLRWGVEVDARELLRVATDELAKAQDGTVGALALQALINWLLVGAAKIQEIRTI